MRSSLCIALLLSACVSVKPAVIDRHAALENQIVGRIRQLEADLVLSASVRGGSAGGRADDDVSVPAANLESALAREAVDAARRRAFNADDLARFKARQLLGEGNDGEIKILRLPLVLRQASWLRDLVEQENHDRAVLLRRALQLSPQLGPQDLPLVRHAFVRLIAQTAQPGQRLQGADGRWFTVGTPR